MQMLKVNGEEVEFTFDTGADVSTVTEQTTEKLGLKLCKPDRHLEGADGSRLKVAGVVNVCIKSKYRSVSAPLYALKGS